MTREIWVWCGLAVLSLAWCAMTVAVGGGLLIPTLVLAICVACVADGAARERVARVVGWTFSGSALRTVLIVGGALMLIQVLPAELALLAAGDVLAYVEVAAAASLIAANTRLRPLVQAMTAPVRALAARLLRRPVARQARTLRLTARRKAPPADGDGAGWAFA